jgi:hypothetical protein
LFIVGSLWLVNALVLEAFFVKLERVNCNFFLLRIVNFAEQESISP